MAARINGRRRPTRGIVLPFPLPLSDHTADTRAPRKSVGRTWRAPQHEDTAGQARVAARASPLEAGRLEETLELAAAVGPGVAGHVEEQPSQRADLGAALA